MHDCGLVFRNLWLIEIVSKKRGGSRINAICGEKEIQGKTEDIISDFQACTNELEW